MPPPALDRAAIIGLGANLEDPPGKILEAVRRLSQTSGLKFLAISSLYLTEPQGGPPDQAWYCNAVAGFESRLAPERLLAALLATEEVMGRRRAEPCGPRVIDLDFLARGDLVIDQPGLILPHPRLPQRLFVLAPLAEIAPDWRHPVNGRTAAELLAELDTTGQGLKKMEGAATSLCPAS
ncbi:MAG: 2-amino-4-hydroxy-6-hydroxymethyldihydropteridine diphosphokinase [Candidatus Adiutrix sp.]|jgi:2-amino-4-hydroxy-6-hydroxymethyldihydropteridine diphosphokinase|nr:2-amino-4-hydroxy-6-hydroxymethyldihydropteridine diphosphokinase [Candidatus Adiutrix sp.]